MIKKWGKLLILLPLLLVPFKGTSSVVRHLGASTVNGIFAPTNLVANGGFEKDSLFWTASGGTFTQTSTNLQVARGTYAASWDSNAASQTFSSKLEVIPPGLYGRNGVASCQIKAASGTATHTIQAFDGTNILASNTITSSTTKFSRSSVNFIFPSSGQIRLRLVSVASDEPIIYVDDCILGSADEINLSQVNQASLWGTANHAATTNCQWTTAASAGYQSITDADCPTPTVTGNASAPATKVPGIRFANGLPPGDYLVTATGSFGKSGSSNYTGYQLYDGTNQYDGQLIYALSSDQIEIPSLSFQFSLTATTADITYQIRIKDFGSTATSWIDARNEALKISFYRFPTSSEIAYRSDNTPASWSGYHDKTNCDSWSRTNTAYGDVAADADCNLIERTNVNFGSVTSYASGGSELPGITFTPPRVGRYYICARLAQIGGAVGANQNARLTDGTTTIAEQVYTQFVANNLMPINLCGIYNATSLSSVTMRVEVASASGTTTLSYSSLSLGTAEWSIVQLDSALPSPLLVGSVTSSTTGSERIERAEVSATGTVSNEGGNWINSNCSLASSVFTCTLNSGIFSSTPVCTASVNGATTGQITVAPASSTSVVVSTFNASGTASDRAFSLVCIGAR